MRFSTRWLISVLVFWGTVVPPVLGQPDPEPFDRAAIVDTVLAIYNSRYVYPDVASQMDSVVRSKLAAGEYHADKTLNDFLRFLTRDLRSVTNDRHIWVEPIPEFDSDVAEGDTVTPEQRFAASLTNFGWRKAEILPCGVGYLKVDRFADSNLAASAAAHAFSLVAGCQALIFDLREHHGGTENMQILACSYFFEEPTELTALYWTYLDSTASARTLPHVEGAPMYDKPLYLLTSHATASGAECFAYNLKHAGRATLVGESTAGAAHWTDAYNIKDHNVKVYVPVARPINPVTGTSWEGVGVQPHIETPADRAFDVAYLEILRSLRQTVTYDWYKEMIDWELAEAEAAANPVVLDEEQAQALTGAYRHPDDANLISRVTYEAGHLVFIHHSGGRFVLLPLTERLFGSAEIPDTRIEFNVDSSGRATEFKFVYQDSDSRPRLRITE